MINIMYDGRIFNYAIQNNAARTGIYWVARNLLLELLKREDINVSLYFPVPCVEIDEIYDDLNIHPLPILTDKSDLSEINSYFSAYDIAPEFTNYPQISKYTVLYDVICFIYPEYFNPLTISDYMVPLAKSLNSADYYFAISDNTRNDFIKYFNKINQNNIKTMLLSTNIEYKPDNDTEKLKLIYKKYNIPTGKKYLFSLCSLEPRKNLIKAVKNFISFINKHNIDDLVYVLGGSAWGGFIEKLEEEVPDYQKFKDKIIRAGYVADEDLEALYSNAEWFVYTSQYEGFGMPPLEAMSCMCPVITSNNSSLPEVVGESAISINYDSDDEHIQAYEKYYFDKQYKDEMAKKGLERSKLFSWKKAADIILEKMYEVEEKKINKPLVTIITPTKNLAENRKKSWFLQNLNSVHNQTYKNIEQIVIDGASGDSTIKLLEKYQNKNWIKYYSEPDNGILDALNKGIMKANGKYIIYLNSDEFYFDKKAIEYLVTKAEETNAEAVYANSIKIESDSFELNSNQNRSMSFVPVIEGKQYCKSIIIKTDLLKTIDLTKLNYKFGIKNILEILLAQNSKNIVPLNKDIAYSVENCLSETKEMLKNKDIINGIYEFFGKERNLTKYDCYNLYDFNFLKLPVEDAIDLGRRLVSPEYMKTYFDYLFNYYKPSSRTIIQTTPINSRRSIRYLLQKIFSLKNEYSNNNIKRKILTVCGIKFKIKA